MGPVRLCEWWSPFPPTVPSRDSLGVQAKGDNIVAEERCGGGTGGVMMKVRMVMRNPSIHRSNPCSLKSVNPKFNVFVPFVALITLSVLFQGIHSCAFIWVIILCIFPCVFRDMALILSDNTSYPYFLCCVTHCYWYSLSSPSLLSSFSRCIIIRGWGFIYIKRPVSNFHQVCTTQSRDHNPILI